MYDVALVFVEWGRCDWFDLFLRVWERGMWGVRQQNCWIVLLVMVVWWEFGVWEGGGEESL